MWGGNTLLIILPVILPVTVLSTVTIPTLQLWQNTLHRWNTRILSPIDRSERWNNFLAARESVDRSTSDVVLTSLNAFSVLNNTELAIVREKLQPRVNLTHSTSMWSGVDEGVGQMMMMASSDLPAEITYWEDVVGVGPARDQMSCGSCWSFPNIGTLEVMNRALTGDSTEFSEQFYVDCLPSGINGCAGGTTNQGYKQTTRQQFLLSTQTHPYTADYKPCAFTSDIETFTNNAMTKIWLQDWFPVGNTAEAVLRGLMMSPVAVGTYVGSDFFGYSGGILNDPSCATDGSGHAMLLIGYTERILRLKNSYGDIWGDYGFVNYRRGDGNLVSCRFYQHAFSIAVTYRRELEYRYCNESRVVTYGECAASCAQLNTDSEQGWTLAVIPSLYHNNLVVDMLDSDYPGVKADDKFNLFWMGLEDKDKDMSYTWADNFTPFNFASLKRGKEGGKFGMIDKNNGGWVTKNSLTYRARGLCSRAKQCWDIGTAVSNGAVTFSKTDLSEGTIATVTCSQGYNLHGTGSLRCVGGKWNQEIPTCAPIHSPGTCVHVATLHSGLTLSPSGPIFASGDSITARCLTGSVSTHTCNGKGVLTPPIPHCRGPRTCVMIPEDFISLDPVDRFTFLEGEEVRATCVNRTSTSVVLTCRDGVFEEHFNPTTFCYTSHGSAVQTDISVLVMVLAMLLTQVLVNLEN